jgi:haloalkane dehalogenase
MQIGQSILGGMAHPEKITEEIVAAYEAPFPDVRYKAGAAVWPLLVPISPHDPASAEMQHAREVLSKWDKPALVMFSDKDPITGGGERFFRSLIPTAKDQPEIIIKDAGHFLQEEKGQEIAQHILDFVRRTPLR